jgi:hypothetical protein
MEKRRLNNMIEIGPNLAATLVIFLFVSFFFFIAWASCGFPKFWKK